MHIPLCITTCGGDFSAWDCTPVVLVTLMLSGVIACA